MKIFTNILVGLALGLIAFNISLLDFNHLLEGNSMIALICGDVCVWKASEKTPLCAIACNNLLQKVLKANNLPDDKIRVGQKLVLPEVK